MRGSFLHVAKRDAGIQRGSDECVPQRVGRDGLDNPGAARDLTDDPPGAVPVQSPPISGEEYRPVTPFAGGQVDRPGGPRRQRDGHNFAAFAGAGGSDTARRFTQRRACTYQAQELEMDVEEINRRTAHLGHREAAGIVADLSKDWSQFYKEFAISSMARAGRTPRSQSLRLARGPRGPVHP